MIQRIRIAHERLLRHRKSCSTCRGKILCEEHCPTGQEFYARRDALVGQLPETPGVEHLALQQMQDDIRRTHLGG